MRSGSPSGRSASGRIPSRSGLPAAQIAEIQRSRLLTAAVSVMDECGYADVTVGHIATSAGVSRRMFYELFADREECLLAALESIVETLRRELAGADLDGRPWRERVRTGLWRILCFFDREPLVARVCVVQAAQGGPRVLARREEILAGLAAELDRGRGGSPRVGECSPLTAEGLVGAVLAIVHARLKRGRREPLAGLLGELMGMIALPYLGAAVARREGALPAPAPVRSASRPPRGAGVRARREDPLAGVPMRLTYRTVRVLEAIAEQPGASNRLVGERAGISDQGQVSKLLARLGGLGLLANTGEGHVRGEPNRWRLTDRGMQVTQTIRAHAHNNREVAS
ncbi:MAG TPA: TetR/AcrR family transcriptional regulator [Solirubrobacteraceae bacterium]|nr:TetR/AcrR family transcriptional regulator [Solirubrobacteraceae bacterium]